MSEMTFPDWFRDLDEAYKRWESANDPNVPSGDALQFRRLALNLLEDNGQRLLTLARRALEQARPPREPRPGEIDAHFAEEHRKALEQPVPTGEVTERVERLLKALESLPWQASCTKFKGAQVALILEALQAGRESTQGGWVAVIQDAYDLLTDGDAEGAIRTLRAALPPPPSDPSKDGE